MNEYTIAEKHTSLYGFLETKQEIPSRAGQGWVASHWQLPLIVGDTKLNSSKVNT